MDKNYDRYTSFVAIYNRDKLAFFNGCNPRNWLDHCFTWRATDAGQNFWFDLDDAWRNKYYNEIQRK